MPLRRAVCDKLEFLSPRLIVAASGRTCCTWNIASGIRARVFDTGFFHQLVCSPTGSHIATTRLPGSVAVWDTTTGRYKYIGNCDITAFAFSPGGTHLATISEDWAASVWPLSYRLPLLFLLLAGRRDCRRTPRLPPELWHLLESEFLQYP